MNQTSKHHNRILTLRVILTLCIALYVILPVIALRWASIPFPGFMRDPNFVVSDIGSNSDWPAKTMSPPITYPDRIIAMDGTKTSSSMQYQAQLSTYQIGDDITFTIEQPQNSVIAATQEPLREQTVPLIAFSSVNLWNYFWLYYFCGLIYLIIGIGTFYLRPDTSSAQIFALLSVVGAISLGAVFDLNTTQYFTRFWLFGMAFVGSVNLLLAANFPYKNKAFDKHRWLNCLIFVPSLINKIK